MGPIRKQIKKFISLLTIAYLSLKSKHVISFHSFLWKRNQVMKFKKFKTELITSTLPKCSNFVTKPPVLTTEQPFFCKSEFISDLYTHPKW